MSKRHYFPGLYLRTLQHSSEQRIKTTNTGIMPDTLSFLYLPIKNLNSKMFELVFVFTDNYLIVISILLVLFLSFLLPNIRMEVQTKNELKPMKMLDKISYEVQQAEVACMAAASELHSLKSSVHDLTTQTLPKIETEDFDTKSIRTTQSVPAEFDKKPGFFRRVFTTPTKITSNKEVTLMSYLYTDSFDSKNEETK